MFIIHLIHSTEVCKSMHGGDRSKEEREPEKKGGKGKKVDAHTMNQQPP